MKKYIIHNVCNFCKKSDAKIIYKLNNSKKILKCSKCSLVYIDKQRIDLENLYNKDYYLRNESNMLANYADYKDQEKIVKQNFNFAYTYIAKNMSRSKNKLLDIGAGFGYFIKYLPSAIQSEAVEVSKEAADSIIINTKSKIYNGDFLEVNIKNKFDFIVSYDVIEHQNYLVEYLLKIRTLLKKEGTVIVTTPDFDSPINKFFGMRAPLIQPLYHNYYFTQYWFRKNMRDLGYKIISLKTSYLVKSSIGNIILLGCFAFPFLRKIYISKLAKFLKIDNITIPFFRFGGIECILQKT